MWPELTNRLPELRFFLLGGFPDALPGGLALNICVALIAFSASFLIAHPLAVARCSSNKWIRLTSSAYIEIMRSIPLLMVLFWFYFGLPIVFSSSFSPLAAAVIALTFYAVAYQAEFIRSGIRSVGRGEIDAARSMGFSRFQILTKITLPQAHKKMLPCYASYFISLFKDTSALYIVGLVELMQAGLIATERAPKRMLEIYSIIGALFFIVCCLASVAARKLEQQVGAEQLRAAREIECKSGFRDFWRTRTARII